MDVPKEVQDLVRKFRKRAAGGSVKAITGGSETAEEGQLERAEEA